FSVPWWRVMMVGCTVARQVSKSVIAVTIRLIAVVVVPTVIWSAQFLLLLPRLSLLRCLCGAFLPRYRLSIFLIVSYTELSGTLPCAFSKWGKNLIAGIISH